MPSCSSVLMRSRTCSVSAGPSDAVGSSMMMMRALKWTARAMATTCRWPPESAFTGDLKFVKLGFRRAMTSRVAASMAPSSRLPMRVFSSRPRNMLVGASWFSVRARVW